MKYPLLLFCLFLGVSLNAQTTNVPTVPAFSGTSRFTSLSQFEQSVRNFEPSKEKNNWAYLFSAAEVGEPDDPETGTIVIAPHISDVKLIWNNDDTAVVFATANPPTNAARSEIGVVILLTRVKNQWSISDYLKYTGIGHYSDVTCELATSVGSGNKLDQANDVFLTIKITEGGRGLSHSEYQTLQIVNEAFTRCIP